MRWRSCIASVPFAHRLAIANGTSFLPCLAHSASWVIVLALLCLTRRSGKWTEGRAGGGETAELAVEPAVEPAVELADACMEMIRSVEEARLVDCVARMTAEAGVGCQRWCRQHAKPLANREAHLLIGQTVGTLRWQDGRTGTYHSVVPHAGCVLVCAQPVQRILQLLLLDVLLDGRCDVLL